MLGDTTPEMPPCDALYLIGYLFEIGPTQAAGASNGPITHSEIEAWQRNTGIELDCWQARTLRSLSIEYLSESQTATKRSAPAPWNPESYRIDAAVNAVVTKNTLRELAKL